MAIEAAAFEDAFADYLDNADYQEADSLTKANAFVTACRKLIAFPEEIGKSGANTRYDKATFRQELEQARKWIASQGGSSSSNATGSTRFLSLENYRS